jgi:sugar lactone lactonase YvrE
MSPYPYSIAVDDTAVYFSVRETGQIHRVSKSGGAVTVVAEEHDRANGAETIATDATHVYWAAVGGIFRAPKTATSAVPERIAEDDEGAAGIAVDDASVYWIARGTTAGGGAFYKVAKTGGEKITLGTGDIFRPTWGFSIAAHGGFVYLPDTERGRVYRADASTGALTLVAEGQDRPVAIAVDDRRVYWSNGGVQGSRSDVRRLSAAPLAGGNVEVLVSTRQVNINAIAATGRGVFFTDYVSTGSVYAVQ